MTNDRTNIVTLILILFGVYFIISTALSYVHPSNSDVYLTLDTEDSTFKMSVYSLDMEGTFDETKENYKLKPIYNSYEYPFSLPMSKSDNIHINFFGKFKFVNEQSLKHPDEPFVRDPDHEMKFVLDKD
ncbi:hypothetical protein RSJ42_13030 [Methanosarcina hadiensis]|uniref:hypothetical protein n=1 Tax=Methanosarcina hadiensis TaxID=3078083 RepID=UPI00397792D4